jgi:hypothetical protein
MCLKIQAWMFDSRKNVREGEALKKKIGSQNYRERSPGNAENRPGKKVANLIMNRSQQDRSNLDGEILKYALIEIKAKSLMKSAVLYLRNDRFGSEKWQNVLKNSQKVTKSAVLYLRIPPNMGGSKSFFLQIIVSQPFSP